MFGLFKSKRRVEDVREETKKGFESVKKDILSVTGWIKHLDSEKDLQKKDVDRLKEVLSSVKEDIEGLKNAVSILGDLNMNAQFKQPVKTPQPMFNQQTPVYSDQTSVQTNVQTPKLSDFSLTERAILFILLNTDMKLSYDDLASMLNKEKSTIRGQINTIKSKNNNLIEEVIEKNGKKRIYITEKMKEKMLKKQKVRVKEEEITENYEE